MSNIPHFCSSTDKHNCHLLNSPIQISGNKSLSLYYISLFYRVMCKASDAKMDSWQYDIIPQPTSLKFYKAIWWRPYQVTSLLRRNWPLGLGSLGKGTEVYCIGGIWNLCAGCLLLNHANCYVCHVTIKIWMYACRYVIIGWRWLLWYINGGGVY